MDAKKIISRVQARRSSTARMEVIDQYTSTAMLRIEVPIPMKKLLICQQAVLEFVTGDKEGTWSDFVSGKKVSKTMRKASFIFCVLMYALTEYIYIRNPEKLTTFWTASFLFLYLCRAGTFNYSSRRFLINDIIYLSAFMTMFVLNFANNNTRLWKAAFVLASGMPLATSVYQNSLTFSSPSSMSNLCSNFICFMPSLVLLNDLDRKRYLNPGLYAQIASPSSPSRMFSNHFMFPAVIYVVWLFSYLMWTEVFNYDVLYTKPRMQKRERHFRNLKSAAIAGGRDVNLEEIEKSLQIENEETMMKQVFSYFKPHANSTMPRKRLIEWLRTIGLLKSTIKFSPERKPHHHRLVVAIFTLCHSALTLALFPLSLVFLKSPNQIVFKGVLVLIALNLIVNGAETMFPVQETEFVEMKGDENEKDETASVSTWESSDDEEQLVEGGDQVGERWDLDYRKKVTLLGSSKDLDDFPGPNYGIRVTPNVANGGEFGEVKTDESTQNVDEQAVVNESENIENNPPPATASKEPVASEQVGVTRLDSIDGQI